MSSTRGRGAATPQVGESAQRSAVWTRAFGTYWSATSLSNLGSGVTLVALPILAAQQLGAGAVELGYLRASEAAPYLVLALVVGQLADRFPPLLMMIVADVVRALLLVGVVVLATTSLLHLPTLYVAVFVIGALTVTYDVAQFTFMPAIVDRTAMVPANSAVELARGAAFTFGPSLGGLLASLLRATPALLVDALSYVYSAVALTTLRRSRVERTRPVRPKSESLLRAVTDGLRFVATHPQLRATTAYLGVNNICNQAFLTGLIACLEVGQHRSSVQVGLAFGSYGAGFLLAATVAPTSGRRFGTGVNVVTSSLLSAAGTALLAGSATLPEAGAAALGAILVGAFLVGFAAPLFNVHSVALRLSATPADLLGRVNAVVKLISQGSLPLGALAAGFLFAALPATAAFLCVATVSFLATGILVFSPVVRTGRRARRAIP